MKKVMVVEDSPVDSEHLSKILRGAGCAVSVASSGDAALDLLQSNRPDLVLMDINMPGTDGFATARKMGRHADMKDIPVVFVTSKDQKADRVFAQMLGAKAYITKPYKDADILALI
jgi:twitching motility two-component system response regulator PilH